MALPIPGHTCNRYCQDGNHAIPHIGPKSATEQVMLDYITRAAARYGWKVLSHKPCEADADQWAASHNIKKRSYNTEPYTVIITAMNGIDPHSKG